MTSPPRAVAALLLLTACATPNRAPAGRAWVHYDDIALAHVKDPHRHRGPSGQPELVCQACHVAQTPALLQGPVATCQRCHPTRHTPGHEAGTPLPASRVGSLPLVEGRLVCHSCHEPHDVQRQRYGLRLPLTPLCRSCHPKY